MSVGSTALHQLHAAARKAAAALAQAEIDLAAAQARLAKLKLWGRPQPPEPPRPPRPDPTIDPAILPAEREVAAATARVAAAEADVAATNAQLEKALAGLFRQLDTSVPLALLPVRLETRFKGNAPGQRELLIRIYPDDIHSDTHEPELNETEASFGRHFWEEFWREIGRAHV